MDRFSGNDIALLCADTAGNWPVPDDVTSDSCAPKVHVGAIESRLQVSRISAFVLARGIVTVRSDAHFDMDVVVARWEGLLLVGRRLIPAEPGATPVAELEARR